MSSGWLSRNRYLIRMSYDNVIMSSGWHGLPFLSHPDEIANFHFPHHAVALQRFRTPKPGNRTRKRQETEVSYQCCIRWWQGIYTSTPVEYTSQYQVRVGQKFLGGIYQKTGFGFCVMKTDLRKFMSQSRRSIYCLDLDSLYGRDPHLYSHRQRRKFMVVSKYPHGDTS